MTDLELKKLKDDLWHSADMLRASAHLSANKYGQPILGLIFLRYADVLYKQHKNEIEEEYNKLKGTRRERCIEEIAKEKCGFYLPNCAYYDYINDAPDTAEKATLVKEAMEAIEAHNPSIDGVLPKEVYGQLVPEEEPELLSNIVRVFKDIPETISIDLLVKFTNTFLVILLWLKVKTVAHSTPQPQSFNIWLKLLNLKQEAKRNFLIQPVVLEVCLFKPPDICIVTILLMMI